MFMLLEKKELETGFNALIVELLGKREAKDGLSRSISSLIIFL
jgi:hypothetical protein